MSCTEHVSVPDISSMRPADYLSPEVAGLIASETDLLSATVDSLRALSRIPGYMHVNNNHAVRSAKRYVQEGYPARSAGRIPLQPPLPWGDGVGHEANIQYQLNALYAVAVYLQAYDQGGDTRWLSEAFAIVHDWIQQNYLNDLENKFRWNDMAVGVRAGIIAHFIVRAERENLLAVRDLELFLPVLNHHVELLRNPEFISRNNHGLFQLAGLGQTCMMLPFLRNCAEAGEYVRRQADALLSELFSDEGVYLEHSPGYHLIILSQLDRMLSAGVLPLEEKMANTLRKGRELSYLFLRPDGKLVQFGDTELDADGYGRLHPFLANLLSGGKEGRLPPDGVFVLPDAGYVIVRSDKSGMLALTTARHSSTHRHADDMAFEWYDAGRPLLVDSGKYSYGSREKGTFREYMISSRAHNVVEIDASDFSIYTDAMPNDIGAGSVREIRWARARRTYPEFGVTQTRVLLWRAGRWLLVVDELNGSRWHQYTQWFHLAPDMSLQDEAKAEAWVALDSEGEVLRFDALLDVDSVQHARGERTPRLQGWYSTDYGKVVDNDAIGYSKSGRHARFATLLSLAKRGRFEVSRIDVDEDSEKLSICVDDILVEIKANVTVGDECAPDQPGRL